MDPFSFLFLLVCFIPIWVPLLIAIFGHREPVIVRCILGLSGAIAGVFAGFALARVGVPGSRGGGFDGFSTAFISIPLRAGILSFYLAFTGICLVTVLRYILVNRQLSIPAVFAGFLFVACIVSGVLFTPWLFTLPQYD